MFNKIKQKEKTFFGRREAKGTLKDHNVIVEYQDGNDPNQEIVSVDEWQRGHSDKPKDDPRLLQEWFVERTLGMREEIHKVLERYNPRFGEMGKLFQWVHEAYVQAYQKASSLAFGVEDFRTDTTINMLCKKLEEAGKLNGIYDHDEYFDGKLIKSSRVDGNKIVLTFEDDSIYVANFDEWQKKRVLKVNQLSYDLFEVFRKHDLKITPVMEGHYFGKLKGMLERAINMGVSIALGSDDEHRRTSDLQVIIDKHSKPPESSCTV